MVKPSTIAPIPFGRYLLHEKIGSGGMAEIFLATARGEAGFQKTCVIKRVLPHLAVNESFVRMFLNEARIAARLSHPGIVQTFDLGKEGDSYFLAMEYLAGEDCADLLNRCQALGQPVPITVAARVISAAAEALHHAHDAQDEHGRPLGIVHRDISPSNLLVTYQGAVKVLDFGIARVQNRVQNTEAGTLKGKLAYMAPEQAKSAEVDRRADVWSLGVCLFELLTGRRLFSGESLPELLHQTQTRLVSPPSATRGEIPEELDRIVLRALERNPERRFPSALAMRQALEGFLGSRTYVASSVELSEFLLYLYGDERARERIRRATPATAPSGPATAVEPSLPVTKTDAQRSVGLRQRTRLWPIIGGVIAIVAMVLVGGQALRARAVEPAVAAAPVRFSAELSSVPSDAAIFLDGERLAERTPTTLSGLSAGTYELRLLKDGYGSTKRTFTVSADRPRATVRVELDRDPPPTLPLSPVLTAASPSLPPRHTPEVKRTAASRAVRPTRPRSATGFITVRSNAPAVVTLDGVKLGKTPLREAQVPPGRHRLQVVMAATGATRTFALDVPAGETVMREVTFEKGRLNVAVDPWADVWAGDLMLGQTPLAGREVWEGRHRLRLVGPGLEKTVEVEVRPGQTTVLEAQLR